MRIPTRFFTYAGLLAFVVSFALHLIAVKDLKQNYPFLFYGMFAGPAPPQEIQRIFPYAVMSDGREVHLVPRKIVFPYGFNRLPRYFRRHYEQLSEDDFKRIANELRRVYQFNLGDRAEAISKIRIYKEWWTREPDVKNWNSPDSRELLKEIAL